ncbi:MAG: MFS transporter, partial [Eubacterium sp.]
ASIIYYVPYMKASFYDALIQAFQVSNVELGVMTSAYTTMTIATYFLGGLVADKFSARKLLAFSYTASGLLCIFFGTIPDYRVAVVLFAVLGVTTTLTFWSALIKAIRLFARPGEEGKAQGDVEGTRSILAAILGTVAIFIFSQFSNIVMGMQVVIFIFGGACVLIGILIWIFFEKDEPQKEENLGIGKILIACLKNPNVWLMSMIVFGAFVSCTTTPYMTPYGTKMFGLSITLGAILGMFRDYMQPIGALISGNLSNKTGISKLLIIVTALLAVVNIFIAAIPQQVSLVFMVFVGTALGYIVLGAARGIYFATLPEADIPMYMSGTVIGIISTIGFLPDSFMPIIIGNWLDNYPPELAYRFIFIAAAVGAVMSCIFAIIFHKRNKATIEKLVIVQNEGKKAKAAE